VTRQQMQLEYPLIMQVVVVVVGRGTGQGATVRTPSSLADIPNSRRVFCLCHVM